MRNTLLLPNRHRGPIRKPRKSLKFVSHLSKVDTRKGIVTPRDPYNWINYKYAIVFTILIGIVTYFTIDYLFF